MSTHHKNQVNEPYFSYSKGRPRGNWSGHIEGIASLNYKAHQPSLPARSSRPSQGEGEILGMWRPMSFAKESARPKLFPHKSLAAMDAIAGGRNKLRVHRTAGEH